MTRCPLCPVVMNPCYGQQQQRRRRSWCWWAAAAGAGGARDTEVGSAARPRAAAAAGEGTGRAAMQFGHYTFITPYLAPPSRNCQQHNHDAPKSDPVASITWPSFFRIVLKFYTLIYLWLSFNKHKPILQGIVSIKH